MYKFTPKGLAAFRVLCMINCANNTVIMQGYYIDLSYDVASGSEITPCNKICKPLVVYRFSGNVMTSITTLRT